MYAVLHDEKHAQFSLFFSVHGCHRWVDEWIVSGTSRASLRHYTCSILDIFLPGACSTPISGLDVNIGLVIAVLADSSSAISWARRFHGNPHILHMWVSQGACFVRGKIHGELAGCCGA